MLNKNPMSVTPKSSPALSIAAVAGVSVILSVVLIAGGRFALWLAAILDVPYKWIVFALVGIVVIVCDYFHKRCN